MQPPSQPRTRQPTALSWPPFTTPSSAPGLRTTLATTINFQDIDNRNDHDAAYPSVTFVGDEALVTYYSRSTKWKRDSEVNLKIFRIDQFHI